MDHKQKRFSHQVKVLTLLQAAGVITLYQLTGEESEKKTHVRSDKEVSTREITYRTMLLYLPYFVM